MNSLINKAEDDVKSVLKLVDEIADNIIGLDRLGFNSDLTEAIKLALLDAYWCGRHDGRPAGLLKNNWSHFINSNLK